jgi:hypothetical protein
MTSDNADGKQRSKQFFRLEMYIKFQAWVCRLFFSQRFIPRPMVSPRSLQVVIAAYKESLNWLQILPSLLYTNYECVVYSKHETNDRYGLHLPNLGRCDQSYVYHIVNHYDTLPDILVFATGSTFDLRHKRAIFMNHIIPQLGGDFECIGACRPAWRTFQRKRYGAKCAANGKKRIPTVRASQFPFGKWCKEFLPHIRQPRLFYGYGVFACTKDAILKTPLDTWKRLLKELEMGENLEAGHFMERSWKAILER